MKIIIDFPKTTALFLILISTVSCKETTTGKYLLTKKGVFENIDFRSLSSNVEGDLKLTDYHYFYENINLDGSDFSIVLVDYNQNNEFNDSDDVIKINVPISSNTDLNNLNFTNSIEANKLFSIDTTVFSINSIDKKGTFYEIEINKENLKIDDVPIQNRMISKLPGNLSYEDTNNKKVDILNENKKFIYIEFWSTSCSPCLELIPEIKNLNDQYSDVIEIHSIAVLNNRNTREQIYEFLKSNKELSWNVGFTNKNLESQLRFGGLPMGYFFDNKGNLLIFNATPQKIEEFLSKNKI